MDEAKAGMDLAVCGLLVVSSLAGAYFIKRIFTRKGEQGKLEDTASQAEVVKEKKAGLNERVTNLLGRLHKECHEGNNINPQKLFDYEQLIESLKRRGVDDPALKTHEAHAKLYRREYDALRKR